MNAVSCFRRATAIILISVIAGPAPAQDIAVHQNLAYKSGDGITAYERERCLLDLYLPAAGSDFAVVVWFHGGGITAGDKADSTQAAIARTLAANGIAVASVNYRLSPEASFPAYIDDAAASVAWVTRHAGDYGIDPRKIFVSGHSAGSYLATMIGVDPQYLAAYGLTLDDLAGLIPISGQMVTHMTVRSEQGLPREHPVIDAAAPIFHVSAEVPPFLAIAGSEDLPARPEENRYFIAAMQAANHPDATYLEVEGRSHGTIITQIPEENDPVAAAMIDFIARLSSAR